MPSPIGQPIDALDTPALLLDLDALDANIALMARHIAERGKLWRPHAKAFKTLAIAHALLRAGAIGLTVAKVSEAEIFAACGVRDILIAHIVVGPTKAARLAAVQRVASVKATVDHPDQLPDLEYAAAAAGVTIPLLVDIDVGLGRTGVRSLDEAVALARQIDSAPGLSLDGIMGYEGHALYTQDPAEKQEQIRHAIELLDNARQAITDGGLPCPIVSAAGSGSYQITADLPGVTELQAGGGIFACPYYTELCQVLGHQCAIGVLASVVSRPTDERVILDAGLKAFSNFSVSPRLRDFPEARIISVSAEHATIDGPSLAPVRIGDRLLVTPSYSDLTFVLHDRVVGHRNGRVEADWPLWARGALQ